MTSRERWTVYPLLFMTLGIAVKDKLTKTVSTNHIVCKTLLVTDRPAAQGNVHLPVGEIACQQLLVVDRELEPQVTLTSRPTGGQIRTYGKQLPDIFLGHADGLTGLMYINAEGKPIPVTVVSPLGTRRDRAQQPNQPTPESEVPLDEADVPVQPARQGE